MIAFVSESTRLVLVEINIYLKFSGPITGSCSGDSDKQSNEYTVRSNNLYPDPTTTGVPFTLRNDGVG